MTELKLLYRLTNRVEIEKYFDEDEANEIWGKFAKIDDDAKKINDVLRKKIFGDKRFMNAFLKISKRLKYANVELRGDEISINRRNEHYDGNEICFVYVRSAEGKKCFRQTYSNFKDIDGRTPKFDGTEDLEDEDDIIEQGDCV